MASQEQLNRQKESLQLEKEYQQTLSFSAQIQKDISKEINRGVDARTKIGKLLREHNKQLSSSLSNIQSSEDANKAILNLEKQNVILSKSKNGFNKKEVDAKIKSNNFAIEGLTLDRERLAAAEELDKVQKSVAGGIISQIDAIEEMGSNIPIVGGLFSQVFGSAFDGLRTTVTDAGKEMVTQFGAGGMSLKNMSGALGKFGGTVMSALTNPMVLAGIAIAGVAVGIGLLVGGFKQLEGAGKAFRNETGLLNSQTENLQSNLIDVTRQTAALGASADDVASAAASFTNQFGGIIQPSEEVLANVVALEKNFGVAADSSAKVNEIFQSIGGLSEQAAQSLITSTVELAKQVGVAPSKVIADIADNAETAAMFFQGSVGDLAKAAIEAASLGTSISDAASVANNLLDFENSINAELEASAMLGQSINFNKARELAATGDILGAQQSVLDNLSENVNLNELNTFQLQSIAKASGMEVGELQKQLNIRKQFGPINAQQQAALDRLAAKGNEITSISKAQLAEETKSVIKQQELQGRLEAIGNQFSAIGTNLMMAFAPIVEAILPAFSLIGSVVGTIGTGLGIMVDALVAAKKPLGALLLLYTAFKARAIASAVAGIFSGFSLMGPLGIGLAIAAVAGMIGLISNAQSVGDMFSPADGKTRVSTAEGGLFELSPNDDFAAAPGLLSGGGGGGASAIVSAIEQLGSDIRDLQFVVNMDGAKVAEGVTKVNSRSNANTFGASV